MRAGGNVCERRNAIGAIPDALRHRRRQREQRLRQRNELQRDDDDERDGACGPDPICEGHVERSIRWHSGAKEGRNGADQDRRKNERNERSVDDRAERERKPDQIHREQRDAGSFRNLGHSGGL